jgi:drug/metabolite transporter (DMT)-like permease
VTARISVLEWLTIVAGVFAGAFGALLLKMGARSLVPHGDGWKGMVLGAFGNPAIILGLLLYVVPTVLWIWLLRTLPLTVLQPILSLSYILTAFLALLILREPVPLLRWAGMGLIMIGIFLVSRS